MSLVHSRGIEKRSAMIITIISGPFLCPHVATLERKNTITILLNSGKYTKGQTIYCFFVSRFNDRHSHIAQKQVPRPIMSMLTSDGQHMFLSNYRLIRSKVNVAETKQSDQFNNSFLAGAAYFTECRNNSVSFHFLLFSFGNSPACLLSGERMDLETRLPMLYQA